jgi:hypothetical protein
MLAHIKNRIQGFGTLLDSQYPMGQFIVAIMSILTLNASMVYAHSQCWELEPNVIHSSGRFSSQQEYQQIKRFWQSKRPDLPHPLDLIRGYQYAQIAKQELPGHTKDKFNHCYVGCRITQGTNLKTGIYASWYKEWQDLTDCVSTTSFDQKDDFATVQGALIGSKTSLKSDCLSLCENQFADEDF